MGEGDHMPIGGHKRKYDPKHAEEIKEGGKRAKEIGEKTRAEHQATEVPKAEEDLLKDLEALDKPE